MAVMDVGFGVVHEKGLLRSKAPSAFSISEARLLEPTRQKDTKDMRWTEVLIPPGQDELLFEARPELGIPGAAPVIYVSDSRRTMVKCWFDKNNFTPGYYQKEHAASVLIRDAWDRDPAEAAAATAAAESHPRPW